MRLKSSFTFVRRSPRWHVFYLVADQALDCFDMNEVVERTAADPTFQSNEEPFEALQERVLGLNEFWTNAL